MKTTLRLLFALGLTFLACKTPTYTTETLEKDHLRFGAGGGFTGFVTTYYLLENGLLYQHKSQDSTQALQALPRLNPDQVATLFNFVRTIGPANFSHTQPDNYYQFVEFHFGGEPIRSVFNRQNPSTPETLGQLYDQLNRLLAPPTE